MLKTATQNQSDRVRTERAQGRMSIVWVTLQRAITNLLEQTTDKA